MPVVRVAPLPAFVSRERLLGPGAWHHADAEAVAELSVADAADLAARLRGVGLGGRLLEVAITPPLPRAAVRAARTADARRRRDTSPGFSRPGTRLDAEGQVSLTPEALALEMAGGPGALAGRVVIDATCGAGGNTIGFARAEARVIAIERDAARIALARHNAAVYRVAGRVTFVHGDALAEVPARRGDVLFVDPPWGVDWDRARTDLASLPLLAALLPLAGAYGEVWAKVPPSFDPDAWPGAHVEAMFGVASGDARRVKFLVLRERRPAG